VTPRRLSFVLAMLVGLGVPLWLLLRVPDSNVNPGRDDRPERGETVPAPGAALRPPAAGSGETPNAGSPASPPRPTPTTDAPPRAPGRAPEDIRFEAEFGAPTPELIRSSFEGAVAVVFPDRRLSSDEVEKASTALHRLREARGALRLLPMEAEHATERRRLIEEMNDATRDFEDVMDMDPAAFTEAAQDSEEAEGGVGIDRDVEPDYVPVDDFLEPRP